MDVAAAVESAALQAIGGSQQSSAVRVLRNEMQEQKELVSEIINGPQQVASQIYNSHGQVIPTPSGSSVDMRA